MNYWGFLPLFTDIDTSSFYIHNLIGRIISLSVMFLSIFIYKKRDARTVGTPIASRVFFEVMLVLGCFTIFSFFVMTSAAMWGVLIAGVIYIIINIIVSRAKINVLSFVKWIVKYAVTTAAFAVLMVVTIKTGGFGQIYSRPSAKHLDGAQFQITSYEYNAGYGGERFVLYTGELTSEQADTVMEICKKHIVKGRNDLSAFNIMFDTPFYRSAANVSIRADSEMHYNYNPSPHRHFSARSGYHQLTDSTYHYYELDFHQSIMISASESRELFNELKTLDFVQTEEQYNNRYDDPETVDLDEYYAG